MSILTNEEAHHELSHHCIDFKHLAKKHGDKTYPQDVRRYTFLHKQNRFSKMTKKEQRKNKEDFKNIPENTLTQKEKAEKANLKDKTLAYFQR